MYQKASLDNLIDSLEVGVNETSKYHQAWSPQTPGNHDIIHGSLSLFAWTLGAVLVVVFLWVTYRKGQSALAAQPGPVQFVAGQGVVLPPINQPAEAAAPAA